MKLAKIMAAGLILVGSAFLAESATATVVNCPGDTIAGALQKKGKTIVIKGVCSEDVVITEDDLTLEGDGAGDGISGSIVIDGAQRVVIQDLDVTGSTADGITVINNASATITGVLISGYASVGLYIDNGSTVIATANEIIGGVNGIWVVRNSALRLNGGNDVSGSSEETVFVNQSASFRADEVVGSPDTFSNSSSDVIAVKEVSSLDIRNAYITCQAACSFAVNVSGGATFRTNDGVDIIGDILVSAGSGVRLQDTTILGSLNCNPGSYSFGGSPPFCP